METASLPTPHKGKSRFSKALPVPPSFLQRGLPPSPVPSKSFLPPARKPLPSTSSSSSSSAGPPALPPKETSATTPSSSTFGFMSRPLDSPLPPPSPPQKSSQPQAGAPSPSMTISRRPVAAGSSSLSLPSPDVDESSPLSSLLSAYSDSNRSSDSTQISSADSNTPASRSSAQGSYITSNSPKLDTGSRYAPSSSGPQLDELFFKPLTLQPLGHQNAPRNQEPQKSPDSITKQLPSPPVKESLPEIPRQAAAQGTQSSKDPYSSNPTAASPQPTPAVTQSSPRPQPQIWRRRSLKTEKNLSVTELKLVSSNGSSASSATISAPAPPPKESTAPPQQLQLPQTSTSAIPSSPAAPRSPLPPTSNAAFPGRNIRPVASRQQLADDASSSPDTMGQEFSRVRNTLKKTDRSQTSGLTRKESQTLPMGRNRPSHPTNIPSVSSTVRLPTPEYDDSDDIKSPIVETIVSPVSPASSPELPSEPRQTPRGAQEGRDVRPVKSTPTLSLGPNAGTQASLVPKPSLPSLTVRSPAGLPSSPAASRSGNSAAQNQFPARTTSKAAAQSPITARREREQEADPKPLPLQQIRSVSDSGSVETVKPQQPQQPQQPPPREQSLPSKAAQEAPREDDTTSDPGAERFPRGWGTTAPEGTVYRPVPISEKHHRCFTRHQTMLQSRNTFYPLACQACGLKDSSWRFTCSSCSLRICKSCRMSLRKFGSDLHALKQHNDTVLVEQVEADEGQGGPASAMRPTTRA